MGGPVQHTGEGVGGDGTAMRPSFFSSSTVPPTRGPFVSREQVLGARKADLSEFLLQNHPGQFRTSGHSLYMPSRKSLYIRKGFPGYMDFSTGEHGTSRILIHRCRKGALPNGAGMRD